MEPETQQQLFSLLISCLKCSSSYLNHPDLIGDIDYDAALLTQSVVRELCCEGRQLVDQAAELGEMLVAVMKELPEETGPDGWHEDELPDEVDVVLKTSSSMLDALANSLLPFQEIVQELLDSNTHLSQAHPIYQVMFQHLGGSANGDWMPSSRQVRSHRNCGAGSAAIKWCPDVAVAIAGGCVFIEYSTELFNSSTMCRLLGSYLQLLQQLVEAPATPVRSAAVLQHSDQQLLLSWGAGQQRVEHLSAPLVHEAFAAAVTAATRPDSCCLLFEGDSRTYEQVEKQATALAWQLQAAGVGPGVAVGVLLERSLELPIAVLAVFMAGGCYVPLDPSSPVQRLQGYLEDSGTQKVLTHSRLSKLAAELTADLPMQVLLADQLDDLAAGHPAVLPAVPRDAPAYIIFTSGST
eukprot:gene2671-2973_t